jgi:flagellar motor switch protein FliM
LARVNEKDKFQVFPGVNKDQLMVQVSHVLSEDE